MALGLSIFADNLDTAMENYRIGYFGLSDADFSAFQFLIMPFTMLLLGTAIFFNKGFLKVIAYLSIVAAAIYRIAAYLGIFSETEIGKILQDDFSGLIYKLFIVMAACVLISSFISFFENEKTVRFTKKFSFFVPLAVAAFNLFWLLSLGFFVIIGGLETDLSVNNLWLLAISLVIDTCFAVIFAFASRLRADMVLDEIIDFKDLMTNTHVKEEQ